MLKKIFKGIGFALIGLFAVGVAQADPENMTYDPDLSAWTAQGIMRAEGGTTDYVVSAVVSGDHKQNHPLDEWMGEWLGDRASQIKKEAPYAMPDIHIKMQPSLRTRPHTSVEVWRAIDGLSFETYLLRGGFARSYRLDDGRFLTLCHAIYPLYLVQEEVQVAFLRSRGWDSRALAKITSRSLAIAGPERTMPRLMREVKDLEGWPSNLTHPLSPKDPISLPIVNAHHRRVMNFLSSCVSVHDSLVNGNTAALRAYRLMDGEYSAAGGQPFLGHHTMNAHFYSDLGADREVALTAQETDEIVNTARQHLMKDD